MVPLRESFFRLKTVSNTLETRLKRCLTITDITLLGVGHMVGAGIYVLTGSVVRNVAGPSIVISFALAGLASLLSALCYAEFGGRYPKAGSAYTYVYIGVGELWAFIVGWNIILEHMLGAAAVARSWSGYLMSLFGDSLKNSTIVTFGHFDESFFADSPDFIAFLAVVAVAIFTGLGSKTSTYFNSLFTVMNMLVIAFVVSYGFTFADLSLWSISDPGTGRSSFFPYGIGGTFAGAASCFFAYIGFDGLATAGEEASDPSRTIPLATFISMSIVTVAYILMASALTLMVPFWEVNPTAAFSDAFASRHAMWAKYIVSIGAMSGMTTSLIGSMFALPRCVYAMAEDGLIFKTFGQVSDKTQVPLNAVIVFGAITSVIAFLFDIETLVEFLSIGTLLAYTIVSACVIVLRYRPTSSEDNFVEGNGGRLKSWMPGYSRLNILEPGRLVLWCVFTMIFADAGLSIIFATTFTHTIFGWIFIFIFGFIAACAFVLICAHEQNNEHISFRVPLVPLIPAASVLVNIFLMFHLAPVTWIRLAIWLVVGFAIYGLYGIKHSREAQPDSGVMTKSTTYESMATVAIPP
uniref:Cationic amino acid transporter C-terminal domain-containing protein n=1 Tax=Setaria digitata TaxID=48799 RepID=A0A915PIS6_9BILA